jgi:hypothetical protein
VSPVTNESLKRSGRNFDALVEMDSLSKADFHMTLRLHKYTQPYLDHAYDIVHDFRKSDIRVLHKIEPKEGGAVQEDEDKKDWKPDPNEKPFEIGSPPSIATDTRSNQMVTGFPPMPDEIVYVEEDCKPDPTEKPVEIGSPPSIATDIRSNQMVTGFPPTPDEFVYVEEDCMKYVHGSGPLDIACDFEGVDELTLSNLTRASLQYTDYACLIHDFSEFFDQWLIVDTVQFYQCWVSRSIGSYPNNIFLFPLDYYQATVEDGYLKSTGTESNLLLRRSL